MGAHSAAEKKEFTVMRPSLALSSPAARAAISTLEELAKHRKTKIDRVESSFPSRCLTPLQCLTKLHVLVFHQPVSRVDAPLRLNIGWVERIRNVGCSS
mmetsp:Transcript_70824/g.117652  ORF Transcript_70824/g.117652 Transcript_70824/m.117652 type:complete len:99 (+) Transcript_70824:137-433(+)